MKAAVLVHTVLLATSSAHWNSNRCPFLRKVVPEGEQHIAFVQHLLELKHKDCKAFAQQFKNHGSYTAICGRSGNVHKFTTQVEIEGVCMQHQTKLPPSSPALTSVFPDFSGADLLFEVEHEWAERRVHALWRTHSCKKTGQITKSSIVFGESTAVPEAVGKAGELFFKEVFEKGNCSAYSAPSLQEMSVQLHGDPYQVTKGGKTLFESPREARLACEETVARERRIITSTSLSIERQYYDASGGELILVAKKQMTTVFRPGQLVNKPFALSLKFSKAGQIQVAHVYGTDVVHLDQKYGQRYGKPLEEKKHALMSYSSDRAKSKFTLPAIKKEEQELKNLSPLMKAKKVRMAGGAREARRDKVAENKNSVRRDDRHVH